MQIYQIHFSITILPRVFSLFILTSFSHSSTPPDTFLATGFHTTLQVLFPLSTPTQKHSHIDSLCVAPVIRPLPLATSLAESLSLFLSLNATGKVIRGRQASPSLPLRSSHYLGVIFQIWPLIGFLLRLSQ